MGLYWLGRVLADQGRFDDAIEQYRKADELWQKDGSQQRKRTLHNWARALRLRGNYDEAATKYGEALEIDPESPCPWAYYGLGRVRADQRRFDDAIEQYRKADELWQKDRSKNQKYALKNWAHALRLQKRYCEASQMFQKAIDADSEFPDAYNGLGLVRAAQARYDDAITEYRKADELWQKDGSKYQKFGLWNWAGALLSQNLYEQAAGKYNAVLVVDPEYAFAYNGLGAVLAAQERFDDAIVKYRKADELWQKTGSKDRKYALWNWGSSLLQLERFDEALSQYESAVEIDPLDAALVFDYGNVLAALGRYQDAIEQLDRASNLDSNGPLPRHNKADLLFQLGHYEKGWRVWVDAFLCYERALEGESWSAEQLAVAPYFADVLRDIFKGYTKSEGIYLRVLKQKNDNVAACVGLAILYQQWADSDAATTEIHARLSYQLHRASELLKGQLGKGGDLKTLLSLADLCIETSDWTGAKEQLALAASVCGRSRLKRAEVTARQGLVCLGSEEHAEAVKYFRQALLVKPGDLTLRSDLGAALLRSKQFESAQDEFARVLKLAPGNIDALLGAAQVSIELADDGDPDQYRIAEQHLTAALSHGRNKQSGSQFLRNSTIAKIYYMRGYARTKSYEADAARIFSTALFSALNDFKQCKKLDPNHSKAPAAIEKITKRLRRGVSESLVDKLGALAIFLAGAAVFFFAQLDFFFRGTGICDWFRLEKSAVTDPALYSALTFGSLLFMVAGLYLPKVLKLKVPGIELEKASVDQVSGPSTLGISRSGSLTS